MDTIRPSPAALRLTPVEELQIASAIGVSFQASISQADSKINVLLVIYLASVTTVVSKPPATIAAEATPVGIALLAINLAGFAACGIAALAYLVRALRPRIPILGAPNPFAFPTVAQTDPPAPGAVTAAELVADAWRHNRLLAGIATAKNRLIIKAIWWICGMAVAAAAYLVQGCL
ncbi:hypothetical protein GCM10022251_16540 [Phytohabitans flavus]|uniref:Pycsar effector protein domain-containing protein n=2 Tax=Phytohabitans flavus TaxID=1076124 RepID=A0A6F8Y655_9ACTN|nr:hypothetical protein Pflav_080060 [Phytohabitans flavus]